MGFILDKKDKALVRDIVSAIDKQRQKNKGKIQAYIPLGEAVNTEQIAFSDELRKYINKKPKKWYNDTLPKGIKYLDEGDLPEADFDI